MFGVVHIDAVKRPGTEAVNDSDDLIERHQPP